MLDAPTAPPPRRPRSWWLAVLPALLVLGLTSCADHEKTLATEGQVLADDLSERIASPTCPNLAEEFWALDHVGRFGWPDWCQRFAEGATDPIDLTQVRREVVETDNGLVRSVSYVYWYRYDRTDGHHGLLMVRLSASGGPLEPAGVRLDTCRNDRFCQL